jgi:signal transduction histidine kinase
MSTTLTLRAPKKRGIAGARPRATRRKPLAPAAVLAILERTANECAAARSPRQLLECLVKNAAELTVAPVSLAALYTYGANVLEVAATNDGSPAPRVRFHSVQELQEWALKLLQRADEFPGKTNDAKRRAIGYSFAVPIRTQEQVQGVLAIVSDQPIRQAEQRWLALLTVHAGVTQGLAQKNMPPQADRSNLDHSTTIESAFKQLGQTMDRGISREQLAVELLDILHSVVPFDSGALYKRERSTSFAQVGVRGYSTGLPKHNSTKPMSFYTLPLLHELIVSRKPIYLADVTVSPRWRPHVAGHTSGSWCGIPLVSAGMVVGLLSLGSHKRDFFGDAERTCLELFAAPFALMMQNLILAEEKSSVTSRLSELTRRVITAQEEERTRVSRELHDEAGQSLTALSINLELLQQDLAGQSQSLVERARESVAITRQTMERLSVLARQLRPPSLDALGLQGALEQLVKEREQRSGLSITLGGEPLPPLGDTAELTLYRFVQEALTNVNKHAAAKNVQVHLELVGNEVRVTVHDDGKGFDVVENLKGPRRAGRLGLLGMRERLALVNGQLEIHSVPGDGTLLLAHLPIVPRLERGHDEQRIEP